MKINIDVKMLESGDNIKYKLVFENSSNDTYELNELSFDNNKAIVREVVDNWYRDNMTAYTDDLEDTV